MGHIKHNIMTDFEKLVIAKQYIRKLRVEIGILTSERDECENELVEIKSMTKSERKNIRSDIEYGKMSNKLHEKTKQAQKLKKNNEELIMKIIKLQANT